jgi:hypothetical protein
VTAPSPVELERAAAQVGREPHADRLGVFVYDVLASWADARSLACNPQRLLERALRRGLHYQHTTTASGDVLQMLRHGCQSASEVALVSMLAAHGFVSSLGGLPPRERVKRADRLVTRLDWLEFATDFRLTACVLRLANRHDAGTLLRKAWVRAVLRDDRPAEQSDAAIRGRNAQRLAALANAGGELSRRALRGLSERALDPATRTLALALLAEFGEPVSNVAPVHPAFAVRALWHSPESRAPQNDAGQPGFFQRVMPQIATPPTSMPPRGTLERATLSRSTPPRGTLQRVTPSRGTPSRSTSERSKPRSLTPPQVTPLRGLGQRSVTQLRGTLQRAKALQLGLPRLLLVEPLRKVIAEPGRYTQRGLVLTATVRRAMQRALSVQRELEVELENESLWVRRRTSAFGRTLRASEACYALGRVTGARRREQASRARDLVGGTALALSAAFGGYLVFDGARGGAPLLLVMGIALVALGSAFDVALKTLVPRDFRVDVQVDLHGSRPVRLGRVEPAAADRLVAALSARLSRGR